MGLDAIARTSLILILYYNIAVEIIEQFISFMLHFMVTLFYLILFDWPLVTFKNTVTNRKNEYVRYVAPMY